MATRSLTDIFFLMRTNSIQSRGIYSFQTAKHNGNHTDSDEGINDKTSLMEAGRSTAKTDYFDMMRSREICSPRWIGLLEDAQLSITRLQNKLKELHLLQDSHILRPTLDDFSLQEKHIQDLTINITRIFASTKKTIQQILLYSSGLSGNKESQLLYNVSSALVSSLQNVIDEFRNSQKNYRNKIKRLEATSSQMLFESEVNTSNSDLPATFGSSDALGQQLQTQQSNQTRTFADILIEERNAELAVRWEREAKKITCSVFELNNIFKDLAHMVVQQGSILDFIDYNIEQTEIRVQKGAEELIKTEKYNRSNRKMKFILFLAPVSIMLFILLDMSKF